MSEKRKTDAGPEAGIPQEAREVLHSVTEALWDRGDGPAALARAERLRLGGNLPLDLLITLLVNWGQLYVRLNRLTDAGTLLARAQSVLPRNAPAKLVTDVMGLEGLLAAWRGDMVGRERAYRRALRLLPPGSAEYNHLFISLAHFLALEGRESEVDAELGALTCRHARQRENVLLIRFIQAAETGRFGDARDMVDVVSRFDWDISGHRAFFLVFLDLVRFRWRLVADSQGASAGPGPGAPPSGGGTALPPWAEVMDHLLSGRPAEALVCAKREAGLDLSLCLTKTGINSFNLIRAELASGNWQAAVRLLGLRRGRGNIHYLDDLFFSLACLLAGQRSDAAVHFARVQKACAQHDAAGLLEFELRMACALRPGDLYWLTRAAGEATAPAASSARRPGSVTTAAAIGPERLIGPSGAMTEVREAIRRVAQFDAPVLITGETGVGKEMVARAVHEAGPRSGAPFLAVNCGAIAEGLLESELFGHEKGAFTGAAGAHRGIFETAGAGTILLDEIGEIPPRLQVGLLRVLEAGEIRPVGGASVRKLRCRIIAATNAELDKQVGRGAFRKDLYYRLARLTVHVPPLRERTVDVVPLALHFLTEGRADGASPRLAAELEEKLRSAAWPGNVRELRNAMERMRLFGSEKLEYRLEDLTQAEGGLVSVPLVGADVGAAVSAAQEREEPGPGKNVKEFLRSRRTALRRLDRLRELFAQHGKLTRAEIAAILDIAPKTATADLKELCRQGLVEKVEPSASRRTHYFRLRSS